MYRLLYFIVVIALVAPVGCNRHDDRLWPFGWTKVGEPFDSLTLLMERAHIAYLPIDSLQHYADALSDMAESDPSSTVKDVRARFWQARLKMRNGDYDGAINGFKEALARCDSAKYPYDYKRISWLLGVSIILFLSPSRCISNMRISSVMHNSLKKKVISGWLLC